MLRVYFLAVVTLGSVVTAAPADVGQPAATLADTIKGCRAELFFLLDCSSSVWIVNYNKQLEFVVSLVNLLDISPETTRVGMGVFSDDYYEVFALNRYTDKNRLARAIRNAPYLSGNTYTGKGLQGMRTQGFRPDIVRPNVTKIGIVVTDGQSRHRTNTVAEASRAREENIWLFTIGVGNGIDQEELRIIASSPASSFAFYVDSYDTLDTLDDKLATSICQLQRPQSDSATCGQDRKADVMFVYNAGEMSAGNLDIVRNFIKHVVGEFSMDTGNVRTGVISESCQGGDIELSEFFRREDFARALLDQPRPRFAPLLKKLRLQGYDPARGGRREASKIAVIFVDDVLQSRNDVLYEALLLKYEQVLIHVVGLEQASMTDMKDLATSQTHITELASYQALEEAGSRQAFLDKFCQHL